jgi:hypothetical protein
MQDISKDVAHHRAKIAALSRCIAVGEREANDPELQDAYRGLAAAKIFDYIERVLAEAPELTDAQRAPLAELLRPVRVTGAGAA